MENQLHRADTERYKLLQRLKKVYDKLPNNELQRFVEEAELTVNTKL